MNFAKHNSRPHALACALAAITMLAGCAPLTPNLDSRFGDALSTLKRSQIIDPAASARTDNPAHDGKSAVEATGRYVKSYSAPTPHQSVLNTGGAR